MSDLIERLRAKRVKVKDYDHNGMIFDAYEKDGDCEEAASEIMRLQQELAERKRLETATIDERLDWVAARVAVDEWFKESNAARTGYEVEQFKSRIRSELLDAACELALPYRDRAEKAEQELAEARAAERQLAERTAERDEWSDAFVRTDKQLQAAEAEAKRIRAALEPFAQGSIDVSGSAVIVGYPEAKAALENARRALADAHTGKQGEPE